MANAKFIPAATWSALTEIDVTDGENLFPQLPAGTYRPVLSGVDSVVVPALTAGTIDQATPTVGDTLTVTAGNETGTATYQWQVDTGGGFGDISGATSASFDTTGEPTGDYRRGVSDGVQGPVYTAAVTLGAASTSVDLTYIGYTDSGINTDSNPAGNYTVSSVGFGAADANRQIIAVLHTNYNSSATVTAVTIGGVGATKIEASSDGAIEVTAWIADVPTGTTGDVVATTTIGLNRLSCGIYRGINVTTGDTATAGVDLPTTISLDIDVSEGDAVILAVQSINTTGFSFTGAAQDYAEDIRTTELAASAHATEVSAATPRTMSVAPSPSVRTNAISFAVTGA